MKLQLTHLAVSMPTGRLRERRWAVERAVRLGAVRATRAVSLSAAARAGRCHTDGANP